MSVATSPSPPNPYTAQFTAVQFYSLSGDMVPGHYSRQKNSGLNLYIFSIRLPKTSVQKLLWIFQCTILISS